MPELLMLAVCERVIIDRDGPTSLISIFQAMNFQIGEDKPVPANAVAPIKWCVFTLWQHEPEEAGMQFEQATQIFSPDGSLFVDEVTKFTFRNAADLHSRNVLQLTSVPIGATGPIVVKSWLKGKEDKVSTYRFRINHTTEDSSVKPPLSETA